MAAGLPGILPGMKVAQLSDIHGNALALEAVLHDLGRHPLDQVVCLGDAVQSRAQPAQTVALQRWLPGTGGVRGRDADTIRPSLACAPHDVQARPASAATTETDETVAPPMTV